MADVKPTVRKAYGEIAATPAAAAAAVSRSIGYSADEVDSVPAGANLGLGCGNPLALAGIEPGDVVVDLGSGGGFDCFLAARRVGPSGRVIGVDMTPAMIERATRNAAAGDFTNVEFRLGELEDLPVADASVDLVISNCVISLVPDRARVFREAARVLRPGGRLAVSDTLVSVPVPAAALEVAQACFGLGSPAEYVDLITAAGFDHVRVVEEVPMPADLAFEDALAAALTGELGVPEEVIAAVGASMVSISVVAAKGPLRPVL